MIILLLFLYKLYFSICLFPAFAATYFFCCHLEHSEDNKMEKGKTNGKERLHFCLRSKRRNKEGYKYRNAEILLFERKTFPFFNMFVRKKNILTLVRDSHVQNQ